MTAQPSRKGRAWHVVLVCLLFSDGIVVEAQSDVVEPIFGPPYVILDNHVGLVEAGVPQDAVALWWEKYARRWGVVPYGENVCSYDLENNPSGEVVVKITLNGDCGGMNAVHSTSYCPLGYELLQEMCYSIEPGGCEYGEVFSAELGRCLSPPDGCQTPKEGNPVEVTTGSKVQEFRDYSGRNINVSRHVSRNIYGSVWGFSATESAVLVEEQNIPYVVINDGREDRFLVKRSDQCWELVGVGCHEVFETDGGLQITHGQTAKQYDTTGRLVRREVQGDPAKLITYLHQDFKITAMGMNETVEVIFNSERQVVSAVTPTGEIKYEYHSDSGLLQKVIYPDQSSETYIYTETPPYLLTEIRKDGESFAFWSYDSQGRVTTSSHAGGFDTFTFEYATNEVLVTNPLGKQTRYLFETVNNVKLVKEVQGEPSPNCAAASKSYDYYDNGTLKSKTDWEGRVTSYQRDELGRETARTEAARTPEARTITTEYHPEFNKPTKITEPGLITEMTYDGAGRLLNTKNTSTTAH